MDMGAVIFGVIAAILGVFTLSFTVFWAIISRVENRLTAQIKTFSEQMVICQKHRDDLTIDHTNKFGELYHCINEKADIKTVESDFVRKREHELEFSLLKEKLDGLHSDMKLLKTIIENGNKKG